jgi:transcriptional regulator with XRE-family HTH domain
MTGTEIRQWRERKGLTREDLAKECSVSAATVANWELGRNQPHGAAAEKLNRLVAGMESVFPLTAQEERLLREIMARTGYATREEFLTAKLVEVIKRAETAPPPKSKSTAAQAAKKKK